MTLFEHAKKTIPAPDYKSVVRHKDGDTQDIINTILYADSMLGSYMCSFASAFDKTYDGLYELWDFTRKSITYLPDEPGHEKVKDPRVTWKDKSGDCKSFSLFIGSVLKCLGISYKYRFASYAGKDPTHVYVIAKLNGRDVILDSTIDRFDYEVSYLKKWDKLTKISYLSGAPSLIGKARPTKAERIADAPLGRTSKPFIDYSNMTEGQLTLRLLDEQVKILSSYYGDRTGSYQKARNLIYSASKDLHRISGHVGYIDPELYGLMSYIEYAKERSKKAGIQSGISGFAEDREKILKDCEHARNEYIKYNNSVLEAQKSGGKKLAYRPVKRDGTTWDVFELAQFVSKCGDQIFFVDLYNKHLENTSPHLLYEFIPQEELNSIPQVASYKALNHRNANSSMARFSELDRTNIVLWERNGIMRAAAAKKLIDVTPEGFIEEWKKGSTNVTGPRIGIAFAALLPIIIDAVTAAGALLSGILAVRAAFSSEVRGFGTDGFGPGGTDFTGGGGGGDKTPKEKDNTLTDILPFAGLALGGMLLLNNK